MKTNTLSILCLIVCFCIMVPSIPAISTNEPLTLKIETKQIYNRIWEIKVFATNIFEKQIEVFWNNRPVSISIHYKIPNSDEKLVVNNIHRHLPYHKDYEINFNAGEEKLIYTAYFYGLSNRIMQGLRKGFRENIPTFPLLPTGEYEIQFDLNSYDVIKDRHYYSNNIQKYDFFYEYN